MTDSTKAPEHTHKTAEQAQAQQLKAEKQQQLALSTGETPEQRSTRYERMFRKLDQKGKGQLSKEDFVAAFSGSLGGSVPESHTLRNADSLVGNLVNLMDTNEDGLVDLAEFQSYLELTEQNLVYLFHIIDDKGDGKLDREELADGMAAVGLGDMDSETIDDFFRALDRDKDGYIGFEEWRDFLLLVPNEAGSTLKAAYKFFVEELDLSSEGDVIFHRDVLQGLGYFLAGGLAGAISRTATAPLDRLKVYLIADPVTPATKAAASGASEAVYESLAKNASKVKPPSGFMARHHVLTNAIKNIWAEGGIRSFFIGNGLNVFKVIPESAMKFGSFETAKKFLCQLEGVEDTADLSRASTFLAGGIGGVVSQFVVYPIDTLKFRIQCEPPTGALQGNALLWHTMKQMWRNGGLATYYRGLWAGLGGIFPYAALDLGCFEVMKRGYITREAKRLGCENSDVKIGNMAVLTMGALSGSVGATVVYPINLLRTRLQAQGTAAHPQTYTGIMDAYHKAVTKDGYRGLFRGLAPNLAKVAPAVSISYLVYENTKTMLGLE
ncbi:Calcium-binding mitochondrial carrier SAL1 [Yarrowia sp. C11]|nr:Calcium-binding mitochondrial carrier SAL1 [Yarrowia sp. E02]KAG5372117.1 Calcium-binding mitochondrial carrier SAL1 [Yarrowia sp. C11]